MTLAIGDISAYLTGASSFFSEQFGHPKGLSSIVVIEGSFDRKLGGKYSSSTASYLVFRAVSVSSDAPCVSNFPSSTIALCLTSSNSHLFSASSSSANCLLRFLRKSGSSTWNMRQHSPQCRSTVTFFWFCSNFSLLSRKPSLSVKSLPSGS